MNQITIINNPFEANTAQYPIHETEDVCEFLRTQFTRFPDNARIFHNRILPEHDVTPDDDNGIRLLQQLKGRFYVVLYPGDPFNLAYTWYYVIAIASVAAVTLLVPKIPDIPAARQYPPSSPNNELSSRSNRARVNGRIPDIFGEQISTPDLIGLPYTVYIAHRETEYAYMCVGRGSYEILGNDGYFDVKDGSTRISEIDGASVEIFGPNSSPNSGSPQISIGTSIDEPVLSVQKLEAVNGQSLKAPNDGASAGSCGVYFQWPNEIIETPGGTVDFSTMFDAGDVVNVASSAFSIPYDFSGSNPAYVWGSELLGTFSAQLWSDKTVRFSGTPFTAGDNINAAIYMEFPSYPEFTGKYRISARNNSPCTFTLLEPEISYPVWNTIVGNTVTMNVLVYQAGYHFGASAVNLSGAYIVASEPASNQILVNEPRAINPDWNWLLTISWTSIPSSFSTETDTSSGWIGPFMIDMPTMQSLIANFVAPQGLFKDDGTTQFSIEVEVQVGITPVNAAGTPTGSESFYSGVIVGTSVDRSQRAVTIRVDPYFSASRYKVRARRVTARDLTFTGQISDEIRWKDFYGVAPVSAAHFGDLTTVQSRTVATTGALSLKERRLNLRVCRKIKTYVATTTTHTFSVFLQSSRRASNILVHCLLDTKIGNRSPNEIHFYEIQETIAAVEAYFGSTKASEFNYTFDKDNTSPEETFQTIAGAAFCTAYRRGNVITVNFEKEDPPTRLSFNHRNKLPGSEKRTFTFGTENDVDGVEYEYVSPVDQTPATYYIPLDRSAVNPKKSSSVGIRNGLQAYFHAWRLYQKLINRRLAVEFDATQEAELLIINDRIIVADNTRPDTQDGEVVSKTGLVIGTSQPVFFTAPNYNVFLQLTDGTVQSIVATVGANEYEITLADEPTLALSLNPSNYARATYILVAQDDTRVLDFLVSEKSVPGAFTSTIKAINYDANYYNKDKDYINAVVDIDGNII